MHHSRSTGSKATAVALAALVAMAGCGRTRLDGPQVADAAAPEQGPSRSTTVPGDVPVPPLVGPRRERSANGLEVRGIAGADQGSSVWFVRQLTERGWRVNAVFRPAQGGYALSASKGRRDLGVEATPAGAATIVKVTLYDPLR